MENGLAIYGSFIKDIKDLIYRRQYEAMKKVNVELIQLYWEIGEEIERQQREQSWGKAVVEVLAKELQKEFPGVKGFSASNLWRMRNFFIEYSQNTILQPSGAELPDSNLAPIVRENGKSNLAPLVREIRKNFLPPLVAEISWSKNITIMEKCKDSLEREFYIKMTKRYGWTKDVLINNIENRAFEKYLANQTNFDETLPEKYRLQAKLAVKDGYNFDFIEMGIEHSEADYRITGGMTMFTITVNDRIVTSGRNMKLLDFLRDVLRLTGTKNGCASGACGSCTVIVDGRTARACILTLDKLDGKKVTTIEGLSDRERDVYSWAFAEAGAVQCGFCIPGMVMSAKCLLARNPDPDGAEIRAALRGNICRCTGYVKIIDAVRLAAAMFREDTPIPSHDFSGTLGEHFHRVDAAGKTLGTGRFVDDLTVPGMLHASALRTPYPRARVLRIDPVPALAHPDCEAVFTADDVPGNNKIGHLAFISDWDVMIREGDATRYVGDAVALVVSRAKESLDEIKSLVRVDYEPLEPMTSPAMSLAPGAPKLHERGNILSREHLKRGDVSSALKNSTHVVETHFSVPFTEHAFMEPECAIAMPEGDGLLMWTAGQGIYDEQRECARMLGIDPEKIHVQGKLVGGGFGGKEDMSVQHHAALAAWLLKKPVKVLLSRDESIRIHPKRHAMEMDFTVGCDENGILTGMKAVIVSDTGAYASLGGPVLQRACTHAAGPYNYRNIDIEGTAVYTNNPPAGAFRGFGVSQSAFAMESSLNVLARKVGVSPWEIRYRNAVRPGDILPNGQIADESTALIECLEKVRDVYEKSATAGIASFFKNSGLGVGIPDTSRCIISIEGGKARIRTSAACMGQGVATVTTQIVCEITGLPPRDVIAEPPDTRRTPNAGTTTASRQTPFTGESTRRAAVMLKEEMTRAGSLSALEGREFYAEYLGETDPMGCDKEFPKSHVAYGYAATVAELDDDGRVTRVTAVYDMGTVINPKAAEGQIEGGIAMGLGYALTEDYPLEDCVPKVKFGTLGLFRATDMPEINIYFVKGPGELDAACGAKGVGELATIPAAPAIAGAYFARDGKLRTKLPMEDTFYNRTK